MQDTYDYLRKNVVLVGLAGAAGSGKDYIAKEYFCERFGFKNFSWAWCLKLPVICDGVGSYDDVFHHKPEHIRKVLQIAGTELGRMRYGYDVWVNRTLMWVRHLHAEWGITRWVIPDTRFPNELEAIQNCGGQVWRVISDVEGRTLSEEAKEHASEVSLTDDDQCYDGIIRNYINKPQENDVSRLYNLVQNIYLDLENKKREYE